MNEKDVTQRFLYRMSGEISRLAKLEAPVDTSNLRQDIKIDESQKANYTYSIVNTKAASYAKYIYYGTEPHIIKPRKARALANKNVMFGKKVRHPGTKPNKYFDRARDKYLKSSQWARTKDGFGKDIVDLIKLEFKN